MAEVVYDFTAEPGSTELSIRVGEVLEIVRQDVGGGWWEAINCLGEQGLVPESYVKVSCEPICFIDFNVCWFILGKISC
ncbi:unnamed protein product [Soboliphyme baturini]|uniref:SH3 domain-containing protein n=1 Tax=Soboliphyme baturini TaxID=241478 RepID=A0A183IEM1_9BILA|nr:unnamed protein product [Soboliphyme baturini]